MKIIVADDHGLVRSGLVQVLRTLSDNYVVIEAASRAEVLTFVDDDIDLLLLDLDMPGIRSVKNVEQLCMDFPSTAVVVVSGNDSNHIIRACMEAGALGFIPKASSNQVLLNAIQIVLSGEKYVPYVFLEPKPLEGMGSEKLTARQEEIWKLIAKGLSNKAIARDLALTEGTVKQHVSALFKVLRIHKRSEAILKAKEVWG